MITAKNYAAQVENDFRIAAKYMADPKHTYHKELQFDSQAYLMMADTIKDAIKFVLPDDGTLLNDGLVGLESHEIRLPYPSIVVEYFQNTHLPERENQRVPISKRLILAQHIPLEYLQLFFTRTFGSHFILDKEIYGNNPVLVSCAFFYTNKWIMAPMGWILPFEFKTKDHKFKIIDSGLQHKKNNPILTGQPFPMLPFILGKAREEIGADMALKNAINDINPEVGVLLELLEALTCRNISTAIYQESGTKNAKRIKAGKLPFYETKMLVIDTRTSSNSKECNSNGTHSSPRQHLRRGHIRRLSTHDPITGEILEGKRNIWVNSCVVGDPTKGSINKTYRVI